MQATLQIIRDAVSNMMHSALNLNLGEIDVKNHTATVMDSGADIVEAINKTNGVNAPNADAPKAAAQNDAGPARAAVGNSVTVSVANLDQLMNMARRAIRSGKEGKTLSLPQRQFLRDSMRKIKEDYIPGYRYKAPKNIEAHRGKDKD